DKGLSYIEYPTQKNHEMLERIILNSSNEESTVLDCFAGSGGTLKISDKLGRKWIGMDNSTHSLEVIRRTFKEENISCNFYEYVPFD
ncbi:MAG: DNA methyltransferase, partial [Ekhidna sp.]|nr:DNA methyltransferase [Ekhidna sp.]